jgi:Tfp pilus assembly protein PilZ
VRIQRGGGKTTTAHLLNVSAGGMTISLEKPLTIGQEISLLMPDLWPKYNAVGSVVWCTDEDNTYQIGISFKQADEEFKARMIAQFCHIENYKKRMKEVEGRELSRDEAAKEWINHYAAEFAEACPQQ